MCIRTKLGKTASFNVATTAIHPLLTAVAKVLIQLCFVYVCAWVDDIDSTESNKRSSLLLFGFLGCISTKRKIKWHTFMPHLSCTHAWKDAQYRWVCGESVNRVESIDSHFTFFVNAFILMLCSWFNLYTRFMLLNHS